ncbi:three-Cys-motif partner protein TcmP [Nocardia asiatica]|uniref:three-Cys-motif partner protein TcmP n=1 Tax=Nocardia asiatica TaxID=209252 RepID=UPI00245763C0|nr:three-Cys-motif partner protein TcmP [Nocardia asiatica]
MPVDGPVPWPRVEHTAAKHDIYDRYLRRWFPIILSDNSWNTATYAEGFSGPGVYDRGEDGSPIIAVRAFVEQVSNYSKKARFLFIDDDERCIAMLPEQLKRAFPERPRPEDQMPVLVKKGKCEELLEKELDSAGAWEAPILAVLDSWGNAPVPYRFLQRIANNKGSEVIVTFKPQHFVRFVDDLGESADEVFGGDQTWRQAGSIDSSKKRQFILTCYRSALKSAGFKYLLDFELVDRRGDTLYLVFGTNHRLGVQKMKDSLWEVDRVFGVGFRDPRDSQLEALFEFEDPQLGPLTRLLHQRLKEIGQARVADLRDYTLFNTVFRPEHVIKALRPLVHSGAVKLDNGGRQIRIGSIVTIATSDAKA